MTVRILPYGPGALLVELEDRDPADLALVLGDLPGIVDVVAGARTVMVSFDPHGSSEERTLEHFRREITSALGATTQSTRLVPSTVGIPVHYDGEDLTRVADQAGCSTDEVVRIHSEARYRVSFMGFAPGFGYLEGLDTSLHLPRLASPRTSVPAGSVAIAGPYTAVYPTASPGGWLLLGHTHTRMFDPGQDPPALLAPGTIVRFDPV